MSACVSVCSFIKIILTAQHPNFLSKIKKNGQIGLWRLQAALERAAKINMDIILTNMGFFCRTNLKEFVYLHYFIYIISVSTIYICYENDSCSHDNSYEHSSSADHNCIHDLPSNLIRHGRQL